MPKFIVTQREIRHVGYLVEAESEDAAREKFYDSNDTIEVSDELMDGQVWCIDPAPAQTLEAA